MKSGLTAVPFSLPYLPPSEASKAHQENPCLLWSQPRPAYRKRELPQTQILDGFAMMRPFDGRPAPSPVTAKDVVKTPVGIEGSVVEGG